MTVIQQNISFERQVEILRKISDLCKNTDEYSDYLRSAGYRSYLSWQQFQREFCPASELTCQYTCRIEKLKQIVETPDGVILPIAKAIAFPCALNRRNIEMTDYLEMNKRFSALNDSYMNYRSEEMYLTIRKQIDPKGINYRTIASDTLSNSFKPLGFKIDSFRSSENYAVVSKNLTSNWDLCWSTESFKSLRRAPTKRPEDFKHRHILDIRCYVCAHGRRGPLNIPIGFKQLDIMPIRINNIQDGFAGAYIGFRDIAEIQLLIEVHALLYSLVEAEVEAILLCELER